MPEASRREGWGFVQANLRIGSRTTSNDGCMAAKISAGATRSS